MQQNVAQSILETCWDPAETEPWIHPESIHYRLNSMAEEPEGRNLDKEHVYTINNGKISKLN